MRAFTNNCMCTWASCASYTAVWRAEEDLFFMTLLSCLLEVG